MMEAFHEYFFKAKAAKVIVGGDDGGSTGHCRCCANGAGGKRDGTTSTHDLTTFVWYTEGDGIGISSSITADEDGRCSSCRASRRKQSSHSQSKRRKSEEQGNMCDASTSTFDLTTFVWGTAGNMYTTDSDLDDGDMHNAGRSWGAQDKKRSWSGAVAASTGLGVQRNSSKGATPPRKKKRRLGELENAFTP